MINSNFSKSDKENIRYLFMVVLGFLSIIIMTLCISACDFIDYIETPDEGDSLTAEEILRLQESYTAELEACYSVENYREEERVQFEYAMQDAINEINECATEQEFGIVLEKHKNLLDAIKTDAQYQVEEFALYKTENINKIKNYLDLTLYRADERNLIIELSEKYISDTEAAVTKSEVENAFRDYRIAVYEIPTDKMLYADELAEMKIAFTQALKVNFRQSAYRESEYNRISIVISEFENALENITDKEVLFATYINTDSSLRQIKTAKQLKEDERIALIEKLYGEMRQAVETNVEDEAKAEYFETIEKIRLAMEDRVSQEGITSEYLNFMQDISIDALKEALNNYKSTVHYRDEELKTVNEIKAKYTAKFTEGVKLIEARQILNEGKAEIDKVKTNDQLWEDSVTKFRSELKSLFSYAVLEEPERLTVADDYFELANIIDYYAFYQLNENAFVCDTFRIKLNFAHDDAQTEINTVYWYCELLRTAVGITGCFEDGDYLVIKLIPYKIASVSNPTPVLNRLTSAVEFDSDKSKMRARPDNFDDFAYYKYERTVKVWNSQQLWYALEHEYVPVCEQNSPAELVLNRAKEILREIIMEGMSDEEKIFQIYTWFGRNCQYDGNYGNYLSSSDSARFPDENASRLCSFHVEGALFDKLGVCYSFAKANLLLLRMEGIETYYVFGRSSISDIGYGAPGWAGHAYNYVSLNGNWYIADALRSFYQTRNWGEGISYLFLLMPAKNYYKNFTDRISRVNSDLWSLIEETAYDDRNIYSKLTVDGKSAFIVNSSDYSELLSLKSGSFSLICINSAVDDIKQLLETRYSIYEISYVDKDYKELFCVAN